MPATGTPELAGTRTAPQRNRALSCAPQPARAWCRCFGVLAAATAALDWGAGSPSALVAELRATSDAGFEPLLAATAALAVWVLLGWSATVLTLEAAAVAPGVAGTIARYAARRVAPPAARRLAQGLIGLTLVAGPLVAGPFVVGTASAATPAPAVPSATGWAGGMPFPLPSLDRPVLSAVQPDDSIPSANPRARTLDRPVQEPASAFVPSPPEPARRTAPPAVSELLTGPSLRPVSDDGYPVRRGDTLWAVVARHLGPDATAAEIAREWPRWYAANRTVIGADPNLIRPGEILRPPDR